MLNRATFTKDVKWVFGFTKKYFREARNDWNHVPIEGLVSKPLKIHLGSTDRFQMYTSLLIDG